MMATLMWGSPGWVWPAALLAALTWAALIWGYGQTPGSMGRRWAAAGLKFIAVLALALCLVEPLWHGVRPRPGANLFLILADNSLSLRVADQGARESRGEVEQRLLRDEAEWQVRLGQDFDVRRYLFDSRLTPVGTFRELSLEGEQSSLHEALRSLADRFRQRPVAGILVFTDGIATDRGTVEGLPPIYPVMLGTNRVSDDVRIEHVTTTESNFQSAPILISAKVAAQGMAGKKVAIQLIGEDGKIEATESWMVGGDSTQTVAFRFRPSSPDARFYRVRALLEQEIPRTDPASWPRQTREVSLENNERWVRIHTHPGPYRLLYVSGRPNWELKFLRRALARDEELQLVALIRIAKREAKFDFRKKAGENTNPLFSGFDPEDREQVERYDQPVLLRLGVDTADELRDGFPKQADELFRYDAVLIDDVEAAYFSPDQLSLLHKFVSQRGGGLLMLGGMESFMEGGYARTVLEELAPVYLRTPDEMAAYGDPERAMYQLELTREGWLQPWVRLRSTEEDERKRLDAMRPFLVRNAVGAPKPGASVLLQSRDDRDRRTPALVTQRFGAGRTAALMIGDFWRWNTRQISPEQQEDFENQWIQIARWLVTDVPRRVEVETRPRIDEPGQPVEFRIQVRDAFFEPLDNAQVEVTIQPPSVEVGPSPTSGPAKVEAQVGADVSEKLPNKSLTLNAEASPEGPGIYVLRYVPRVSGPFRAAVHVRLPDESVLDPVETGWVHEPLAAELRTLAPDEAALSRLASATGGELLRPGDLDRFVKGLPSRKVPVTESWTYPLWHRWPVFLLAIICLIGEWGLRRWKGLP